MGLRVVCVHVARYCANDACVMSTHPLPADGGPCPECGSAKYRLDPDTATVQCPACDTTNEARDDTCWSCDTPLSQHRLLR